MSRLGFSFSLCSGEGLEQALSASQDRIPCALVPRPRSAPCPSHQGSPQVLLRAWNLPYPQGVRGAGIAPGAAEGTRTPVIPWDQ